MSEPIRRLIDRLACFAVFLRFVSLRPEEGRISVLTAWQISAYCPGRGTHE